MTVKKSVIIGVTYNKNTDTHKTINIKIWTIRVGMLMDGWFQHTTTIQQLT